jgi:hypothetical protein
VKREQLESQNKSRLEPETQGYHLAVTVVYVPYSLNSCLDKSPPEISATLIRNLIQKHPLHLSTKIQGE